MFPQTQFAVYFRLDSSLVENLLSRQPFVPRGPAADQPVAITGLAEIRHRDAYPASPKSEDHATRCQVVLPSGDLLGIVNRGHPLFSRRLSISKVIFVYVSPDIHLLEVAQSCRRVNS